uniref:Prostaglandin E synthase 2 n=1 Tax=Calcidiscus leptoporus TaxID=127549 RepID=A0A7S0IJQ6_9EUKA
MPVMLRSMVRSRILATAGGLATAGVIDSMLAPPVAPFSTAAAAVSAVGTVRLFQYDICPFCNKIKAMLDLHKIPYETVDVNPLTKKEIKFSKEYRKVPIAMLGGLEGSGAVQVNDSPLIADTLLERMELSKAVRSDELAHFRSATSLEWAEWSDKKLAVLLFPRMTRTFAESFQAFGYVMQVPHFSMVDKLSNQVVGAFAMWMAQGKIKKKYAIDDEAAAVREAIAHWLKEGVGEASFAGGQKPHLGDVAVYGCLKAIDRTSTFSEIMAETGVKPWYERMTAEVQPGNACTSRQ